MLTRALGPRFLRRQVAAALPLCSRRSFSQWSKEENKLREELALCYRVAHHEGLNEGCDNHLSVSLEGQEAMLTLPYGFLWSQCQPEDLMLVDFEGNTIKAAAQRDCIEGHNYEPDESAIKIHGKIHKMLGDRAKAVFHTHQTFATAMASATKNYEIKMVSQNSARFYNAVVNYREFHGIVDNCEEGINMANQFLKAGNEDCRVMLLRHHGIITIGPTPASALEDLYYFERAAKV